MSSLARPINSRIPGLMAGRRISAPLFVARLTPLPRVLKDQRVPLWHAC